jgi:Nucleoside 2-deoxyribosyltransferase
MTVKVYLAGDMLPKASQLLRAQEREQIKAIGLDFYNPMDNKDINDKSKVSNEGLAERIVKADTDAIIESDIVVIEPQPFALGTMVELGQIKGMKDLAKVILDLVDSGKHKDDALKALFAILDIVEKVNNQVVFPHYEDVRRFEGAGKDEEGDRRSLGINQYVYGVCLDLTNGKGFYEWDEVLEELEKIKKDPSLLG